MNKHKIIRDTFFLTAIELILQGLSLLLNVFVTRKLGSSFMGMISLIGSFFGFVTIISSGNIYLSSSRFISEEIGKKNGNPNKVFRYSVVSSVTLSIVIGIIVFSFSELISKLNTTFSSEETNFNIFSFVNLSLVFYINFCKLYT